MKKVDVHTHVGKESNGQACTMDERISDMKNHNVIYSAVFPFGEGDLIENSLKLLEQSKKNKAILPFFRFHPEEVNPEKLETYLKLGFKGIKLHPSSQNFNPLNEKYFPLYRIIARLDLPILFHTTKSNNKNCDPDHIITLAEKFPTLKIILGHFASSQTITRKKINNHPNVYVETSLFSTPFGIWQWINETGHSEKILYGTDHPYSFHEIEALKIEKAKISKQDKENIFYNNAAKLFNLE